MSGSLVATAIGLTLANFGVQLVDAGNYAAALERSFFQLVALMAFAGVLSWRGQS